MAHSVYTRWFKYDRDYLCVNKSQFVPVIFEPPCTKTEECSVSYRLNDRGIVVQPAVGIRYFLPHNSQTCFEDQPASYPMVTQRASSAVN